MDSYIFEEWNFNSCLFPSVEATYILYLEGSDRIHNIKRQIFKNPPSTKVFLVRNKGYKKVKKPIISQTSAADCAYSHYTAAKHALKANYNQILILEDDFIFERDLLDQYNLEKVNEFISTREFKRYFLGVVPFLLLPTLEPCHWKILSGGAAQAIIHNKQGFGELIQDFEKDQNITLQIDIYLAARGAYTFCKPLITQIFDLTENRQTSWGAGKTGDFISWGIETLKMDNESNGAGLEIFYFFGKYWILILILLVIIVYFAVKHFTKKKS